MNNKDVMVGSITEAWLLHEQGMDHTTFAIACTAGVLAVMNYLMDEQAAHEETKTFLKERASYQEGLEIRLGNAEKRKDEAIAARLSAEAKASRLQCEIDARQTYIGELEQENLLLKTKVTHMEVSLQTHFGMRELYESFKKQDKP